MVTKKDQQELQLKDHQINRGTLGIYDTRNKINDLTGKQWTFSTRSVKTKSYINNYPDKWITHFPGILPLELIKELFLTFTKQDDLIYDPFAYLGNTIFVSKIITPKRYFSYQNLKIELYNKFQEKNNGYNIGHKKNVPLKPSETADLIFSQLILPNLNKDKINGKILTIGIEKILDGFINSISRLKDKKYAILSYSNWITGQSNKTEELYFDSYKITISKLNNTNLIPKGEIIWYQPQKSISNLNETRILVMRKEL